MNLFEFADLLDCMTEEQRNELQGKIILLESGVCGYYGEDTE